MNNYHRGKRWHSKSYQFEYRGAKLASLCPITCQFWSTTNINEHYFEGLSQGRSVMIVALILTAKLNGELSFRLIEWRRKKVEKESVYFENACIFSGQAYAVVRQDRMIKWLCLHFNAKPSRQTRTRNINKSSLRSVHTEYLVWLSNPYVMTAKH